MSMARTLITVDDIDDIALGATVLGTGGGGDPHVGALIANRLIALHGDVTLMPVEELTADDFVLPVGMIGAPSVSVERIMAESELVRVIELAERATGRKPTAVMPIEVGGGNSMVPIAAAALSGLPMVDADAMGRAFPESQMVSFHLAGYKPGVTVLVDHHGNEVIMTPVTGPWSERLARAITTEMGGSATMIDYMFGGDIVREAAIPGTLTLAKRIGQLLSGHGTERTDAPLLEILTEELDAFHLFDGKVVDLERGFDAGFTRGKAMLEGIGTWKGSQYELRFQNEMLLALRDGQLSAVTPDLICILDAATAHPITTETLRYGNRISVVGIPADDRWRTDMGIETAGPRYFGFDVDWQPVESLAAQGGPATTERSAS